jgi:hypothetical protein
MKIPLGIHKAALLVSIAFFLGLSSPANASSIVVGTYYEFGFSTAGTAATGCDPADPAGPFCIESSGTPTTFLPAGPWTFTAPLGAVLTVTDAFSAGDRFEVFDFGVSLGLTSAPFGSADCGDDPAVCLVTAGISTGSFGLAAGAHSLTITPTLSPDGGGSGYFTVAVVPEPGSVLLLSAGMGILLLVRKRKAER